MSEAAELIVKPNTPNRIHRSRSTESHRLQAPPRTVRKNVKQGGHVIGEFPKNINRKKTCITVYEHKNI